jgi:serine phosphatase RsbU (regulator of sigma subunit)
MNADGECFGDARLAELVGEHADLPPDELRERILRDIGAFAGNVAQQDDMTMVLLRVEQIAGAVPDALSA